MVNKMTRAKRNVRSTSATNAAHSQNQQLTRDKTGERQGTRDEEPTEPQHGKTKMAMAPGAKRKRGDELPTSHQPQRKKPKGETAAKSPANNAGETDRGPKLPEHETAAETCHRIYSRKRGLEDNEVRIEPKRVRTGRDNPPLRLKDEDAYQADLKEAIFSDENKEYYGDFLALGFHYDSLPNKLPDGPEDDALTDDWIKAQQQAHPAGAPKNLFWKKELDEEFLKTKKADPVLPVTRDTMEVKYEANDVKRFARYGGPDFRSWIGRDKEAPLSFRSSTWDLPWNQASEVRDCHGIDNDLRSDLRKARVFGAEHQIADDAETFAREPSNLADIKAYLAMPRPESRRDAEARNRWRYFRGVNWQHTRESRVDILHNVMTVLGGRIGKERRVRFSNIRPLSKRFERRLKPMPDSWDGVPDTDLDESMLDILEDDIQPNPDVPWILPNFFLDVADEETDIRARCCHTAAVGARGMQKLQSFIDKGRSNEADGEDPLQDHRARTLSVIYYPDEEAAIEIYATHTEESRFGDGKLEYDVHLVGRWNLCGSFAEFREGIAAFINARQFCRDQRHDLIIAANAVADVLAAMRGEGSEQGSELGSSDTETNSR